MRLRIRSRPVWGAWIEMFASCARRWPGTRRAPYGARGLKLRKQLRIGRIQLGRAPYGARGLKLLRLPSPDQANDVAPRMGRVD